MSCGFQILAAGDDNVGKLIGFAVVAAIWIISGIANAMKKQQEQRHRDQVREQLEQSTAPPRVPPPPPPISTRPVQLPRAQVRRPPVSPQPQQRRAVAPATTSKPQPKRVVSRQQARQVGQIVRAVVGHAAESMPTTSTSPPAQITETAHHEAAVTVNAAALSRWLTAKTMRQQFILTEILQPPLALRHDRLL